MASTKSALSLSQSHLSGTETRSQHAPVGKLQSIGQIFMRGIKRTGSSTKIDHRRSLFEGSSSLIQRRLSRKGQRLSQSQDSLALYPPRMIVKPNCLSNLEADEPSTSENNASSDMRTVHLLHVTIGEAKGIPQKKRYYCELYLDGILSGRTSSKAINAGGCFWGECFSFDSLTSLHQITVRMYRECLKNNENTHVGDIPILPDEVRRSRPVEKWYPLPAYRNREDVASLRIKAQLVSLKVLPQECYDELVTYIEIDAAHICASLENRLTAKAKEELATSMVRLLYEKDKVAEFLINLIEMEVNKLNDPKLMFRSNSLGSKSMEAYLKLLGSEYLSFILQDYLQSLIRAGDDCEVDSTKILNAQALEKNQNTLNLYTEVIWQRILHSTPEFPCEIRQVFSKLKQRLVFCDKGDLVDNLVSSSVFLRYLCPAILSPSLFSLVSEYPDDTANRTLTLVAKCIQSLANFAKFDGKEDYMEFMNGFVERQKTNMKQFLHVISTSCDVPQGKRIKLEIDKEAAILAKHLQEATKNFVGEELVELHTILDGLMAAEEDPSSQIHISAAARSLRRPLSDYDNMPCTSGSMESSQLLATSDKTRNSHAIARRATPLPIPIPHQPVVKPAHSFTKAHSITHGDAQHQLDAYPPGYILDSVWCSEPSSSVQNNFVRRESMRQMRYIDDSSISSSSISTPCSEITTDSASDATPLPRTPEVPAPPSDSYQIAVSPTRVDRRRIAASPDSVTSGSSYHSSSHYSLTSQGSSKSSESRNRRASNPIDGTTVLQSLNFAELPPRYEPHRPTHLNYSGVPKSLFNSNNSQSRNGVSTKENICYVRNNINTDAVEGTVGSARAKTFSSKKPLPRPRSAHLLTGGSQHLHSVAGSNGANSSECVCAANSPAAWKMIEDRIQRRYISEMSLLKKQVEEKDFRLKQTEENEQVWKRKYEEIEPKLREVSQIANKIEVLENEMRESHKKDNIISEQRRQIQSLENANAALLAFSLQLRNQVISSPHQNGQIGVDAYKLRDMFTANPLNSEGTAPPMKHPRSAPTSRTRSSSTADISGFLRGLSYSSCGGVRKTSSVETELDSLVGACREQPGSYESRFM